MQFSRKTDYGLILVGALKPTYQSGRFVSLREVASGNQLPYAFMEKLASILRHHGILEAKKGTAGGYRLARDPQGISLAECVALFEEPPMMRCLRSPHPEKLCPLAALCPTRKTWRQLDEQMTSLLERVSVAEL